MTEKWIRDTGLAAVLVSLVFAYRGSNAALAVAGVCALLLLFFPSALRPLAWVWLKITEGLGYVMPPVFFGLVFFAVVTPAGVLRRMLRGDARDIARDTKRGTAFVAGSGLFAPRSLENPY